MGKYVLESSFNEDEYTNFVCQEFDIQTNNKNITVIPQLDLSEIPNDDWNIILLIGNSGSGKSTILNNIGSLPTITYDYDKPIISQFPHLSPEEVTNLFCSVGLSSVPIWLHKPNELSNGERARLDLCYLIANNQGIILVDEFTSVVNRDVAKSLSFSLQRYIRATNKKIILASCHFDLIDWLHPDYIFNLNKQDENGDCELEHLIYKDDKAYQTYQNVNNNDILSEPREI